MQSDLSDIAKTDTSLFKILGQFGSPQFSIILKIRSWESPCLGPTSTVQKEVKGIYRQGGELLQKGMKKIAVASAKCAVVLGLDLPT